MFISSTPPTLNPVYMDSSFLSSCQLAALVIVVISPSTAELARISD